MAIYAAVGATYFLQLEEWGTFLADPRGNLVLTNDEIVQRLSRWPGPAAERLLISHYPLAIESAVFQFELFQSFPDNLVGESLFIYRVTARAR